MDQREKIITNIMKASNIFDELYITFDSKIDLLRNVYNNNSYAKECSTSSQIYEAIKLLGNNAIDDYERRLQQQYFAHLVKLIMSKPTKEQLLEFFEKDKVQFNGFCLMYIHFLDDAISEKEKQAHEFMVGHIINCVQKLIEN